MGIAYSVRDHWRVECLRTADKTPAEILENAEYLADWLRPRHVARL